MEPVSDQRHLMSVSFGKDGAIVDFASPRACVWSGSGVSETASRTRQREERGLSAACQSLFVHTGASTQGMLPRMADMAASTASWLRDMQLILTLYALVSFDVLG